MDRSLIERSQTGDPLAFGMLFEQYKNLVYKTAALMLDSHQEAEDVQQEVFVQVHRNLKRYDATKAAFTTWLHQITVNYCLNRRRRQRLLQWFGLDTFDKLPTMPSPEEKLGDEVVREGLRHLSDKLRVVLILRYYHDLSYTEIQDILKIPLGTVKSRINQALNLLRHDLKVDFPDAHSPSAAQEVNA